MAGESCKDDNYLAEEIPLERKKNYLCLTEQMSDLKLDPSSSDADVDLVDANGPQHDNLSGRKVDMYVDNVSHHHQCGPERNSNSILSDAEEESRHRSITTQSQDANSIIEADVESSGNSGLETKQCNDEATHLASFNNKNTSNDNDSENCDGISVVRKEEGCCCEDVANREHNSISCDNNNKSCDTKNCSNSGSHSPGLDVHHHNAFTIENDDNDTSGVNNNSGVNESEDGARCSMESDESARETQNPSAADGGQSSNPRSGSFSQGPSTTRGSVRVAGRPQGPQRPPVMDIGLADDFNDADEEEIFFFASASAVRETAPDLTPRDLLAEAAQVGIAALWDPVGPTPAPDPMPLGPLTGPDSILQGSSADSLLAGANSPHAFPDVPHLAHDAAGALHHQPQLNSNNTHGANNRETMAVHPTLLHDDSVDPTVLERGAASPGNRQNQDITGRPIVSENARNGSHPGGISSPGNNDNLSYMTVIGRTNEPQLLTQNMPSSSADPLNARAKSPLTQQMIAEPQTTAGGTQNNKDDPLLQPQERQISHEDYAELYEDWDSSDEGTVGSLVGFTNEATVNSKDGVEPSNNREDVHLAAAENDFLSLDVKRHSSGPVIDQRARTDQDADDLLQQIFTGRVEKGMGPNAAAAPDGECSQHNNLDANTSRVEPEVNRKQKCLTSKDAHRKKKCGNCKDSLSASCESNDGCDDSAEQDNQDETSHGIPNINTQSSSVKISQDNFASLSEGTSVPVVTSSNASDSNHATDRDSKSDPVPYSITGDAVECLLNLDDGDLETTGDADKSKPPLGEVKVSVQFQPDDIGPVADTNSNLNLGESVNQEENQIVSHDSQRLVTPKTSEEINEKFGLETLKQDTNVDVSRALDFERTSNEDEPNRNSYISKHNDVIGNNNDDSKVVKETFSLGENGKIYDGNDDSLTHVHEIRLDTICENVCGDASSVNVTQQGAVIQTPGAVSEVIQELSISNITAEPPKTEVTVADCKGFYSDRQDSEIGRAGHKSPGPTELKDQIEANKIDNEEKPFPRPKELKCQNEINKINGDEKSSETDCSGEGKQKVLEYESEVPPYEDYSTENNDNEAQPTNQSFSSSGDFKFHKMHEGNLKAPENPFKHNIAELENHTPNNGGTNVGRAASRTSLKLDKLDMKESSARNDLKASKEETGDESCITNIGNRIQTSFVMSSLDTKSEENTRCLAEDDTETTLQSVFHVVKNNADTTGNSGKEFADENKKVIDGTASVLDHAVEPWSEEDGSQCDKTALIDTNALQDEVNLQDGATTCCGKVISVKSFDAFEEQPSPGQASQDSCSEDIKGKSQVTGNKPLQVEEDNAHTNKADFGQSGDMCNSSDQVHTSETLCTIFGDNCEAGTGINCYDAIPYQRTKSELISLMTQEENNKVKNKSNPDLSHSTGNKTDSYSSDHIAFIETDASRPTDDTPNSNAPESKKIDKVKEATTCINDDCGVTTINYKNLQLEVLPNATCDTTKDHCGNTIQDGGRFEQCVSMDPKICPNLDCDEQGDQREEHYLEVKSTLREKNAIPLDPANKEQLAMHNIDRKNSVEKIIPQVELNTTLSGQVDILPISCNSQHITECSDYKMPGIVESPYSHVIQSEKDLKTCCGDVNDHKSAEDDQEVGIQPVAERNFIVENEKETTKEPMISNKLQKIREKIEMEGKEKPQANKIVGSDESAVICSSTSCINEAFNNTQKKESSYTDRKLNNEDNINCCGKNSTKISQENDAYQQKEGSFEHTKETLDCNNYLEQTTESLTSENSYSSSHISLEDRAKRKLERSDSSHEEDPRTASTSSTISASSGTRENLTKTKSLSSDSENKHADSTSKLNKHCERKVATEEEPSYVADACSGSHTDASESFSETIEAKQEESTVLETASCEQDIVKRDTEEIIRLNKKFHDAQGDISPEKAILEATDLWLEKISDLCKSPTVLSDSRSDAKLHRITAECKSQLLAFSKYKLGASASSHGPQQTSGRSMTSSTQSGTPKGSRAGDTGKSSTTEKFQSKLAFGSLPTQKHEKRTCQIQPMSSASRGEPDTNSKELPRGQHEPCPPSGPRRETPRACRARAGSFTREKSRLENEEALHGQDDPDLPLHTLGHGGRGDVCSNPQYGSSHGKYTEPRREHEKYSQLSKRPENPQTILSENNATHQDTQRRRTSANRLRRRQRGDIKPEDVYSNEETSRSERFSPCSSQQPSCNISQRSPETIHQKPAEAGTTLNVEPPGQNQQYLGKRHDIPEHKATGGGGVWPWQKSSSRAYLLKPKPPLKIGRPARDGSNVATSQRHKAGSQSKDAGSTGVAREKIQAPTLQKRYRPQRVITMKEFEKEQLARHLSQDFRKISRTGPSVDCHMNPYVMRRAKASVERQRARNNHDSLLALENCRFLHLLNDTKSVYHGTLLHNPAAMASKSRGMASHHHGQLGRHGYSLGISPSIDHRNSPAWATSGQRSTAGESVTSQWAAPSRHSVVTPRGLDSFIQTKVKVRPPQPPALAR